MSAEHVLAGLREMYAPPEWAVYPEVRSATGRTEGLRIADLLAVNLWPSRRAERHGIEIKISRSDLAKELRNHLKSEPFRRVCSSWFIAVPAPWKKVVLAKSDIPEGWGLLEVNARGADVVVPATEREPDDLTPEMTLALLRASARAKDGAVDVVPHVPGAPSQLVTRPNVSRGHVGLACGHVVRASFTKAPKGGLWRMPCVKCAEGVPTDREMVLDAIEYASNEDLHYITEALARRGAA